MKVSVGVVQDSPVFFDKAATFDKIARITKEFAGKGCELLVFPESFIPGYPRGFDFGAKVGSRTTQGREQYLLFSKESFDPSSKDMEFLEDLSKKQGVYLIMGVTEKEAKSGSLYCSVLYISPTRGLLGIHRKLKPTGTERIIWGEGSGESLVSFQTKIGRLGGLICWENYMPGARMAMYSKGVEIYIAPTADARDSWIDTLKHIALEGRCFVLGCNQYFRRSMYPDQYQGLLPEDPDLICRGGSVIISPMGEILAGPLFDKQGVLMAELDLDDIVRSKLDFDVNGHYSRPDIFEFRVKNQPDIIIE
jgi:nitrilase